MDGTRRVRPTGMMLDVDNPLSPYAPLPRESVPKNGSIRELQNVPGDGDCLYHSLARMYEFTVEWPLGQPIQNRMQIVAAQYAPGTTFTPSARYLRMLFLDFLREHWDYYYNNPLFRDSLLQVARKEMPDLQPTSESVKRAYIQRMGRVERPRKTYDGVPRKRLEWGGPVECDIASELFGMRIKLWVELPNDHRSYWLNNEFVPQLLAGSIDPITSYFKWELVQTGTVHYQYFQPWMEDLDPVPQSGMSVMEQPLRTPRRVRWADQVNRYEPGAMEKIRTLIARKLGYTWDEFKLWFELNFRIKSMAMRLAALQLFWLAYTYLNQEAEAEAPPPAQLPPFTPFLQGPNMGCSVVDEVFAKHARASRIHKS